MRITAQKKKDFIVRVKSFIDNANSDPYIKEQVLSMGFDEKRFEEGYKLQEIALNSRENQIRVMNKSKSLNSKLQNNLRIRVKDFTNEVRLLRMAFIRDVEVNKKLDLNSRRKRTITGYLEQARALYTTLLQEQEVLEKLAKFKISSETVQGKLKELDELEKDFISFQDMNKEAQEATDECNKEFRNMRDWILEFQALCRIALKERPQLLEKVGILVRSTKPRRKGTKPPDGNGSTPPASEGTAAPAAAGAEKKNEVAEIGVNKPDNTGGNENAVNTSDSK